MKFMIKQDRNHRVDQYGVILPRPVLTHQPCITPRGDINSYTPKALKFLISATPITNQIFLLLLYSTLWSTLLQEENGAVYLLDYREFPRL